MHGEYERNPARIADPIAHALLEIEVMTVAGRKVGPRLRDSDNRLAGLHLVLRDPVVGIPFDINRGHAGVMDVVEPGPGTEPPGVLGRGQLGHVFG